MSFSPHITEDAISAGELRVLILGPLRHRLKIDAFQMPFPANGSQSAFWESLLERFPEIRGSQGAIRLARNSRFLLSDELLNPGDEVALIPPVSGG